MNTQTELLTNGSENSIVQIFYFTWNGSKWMAEIIGNVFYHYENGDKNKCHTDTRIDYIAPDGTNRRAIIKNGIFHDFSISNPSNVTETVKLSYKSWNNTSGTVTIGDDTSTPPQKDIIDMYYFTWNGTKWKAEIINNVFYHYENGQPNKCHTDTRIDYVAPGGTNRRAVIKDGVFCDYPIDNPSNTIETKILSYIPWNNASGKVILP